jgi:hypothetical protein
MQNGRQRDTAFTFGKNQHRVSVREALHERYFKLFRALKQIREPRHLRVLRALKEFSSVGVHVQT